MTKYLLTLNTSRVFSSEHEVAAYFKDMITRDAWDVPLVKELTRKGKAKLTTKLPNEIVETNITLEALHEA